MAMASEMNSRLSDAERHDHRDLGVGERPSEEPEILKAKNEERAEIPVKMTKVLFHDSTEKMGFLAKSVLESLEEAPLLKKTLTAIRVLLDHPPSLLRRGVSRLPIP